MQVTAVNTGRVTSYPYQSPSLNPAPPAERRADRDAARKANRDRRRLIEKVFQAGVEERTADESNLLASAMETLPEASSLVHDLYGLTVRLIAEVAEITGEDRKTVLNRVVG